MVSAQTIAEIEKNRKQLEDVLVAFVKTDTILFAFDATCQNYFSSLVYAVNDVLDTAFSVTTGIDVLDINLQQDDKVRIYLECLPIHKFSLLYLTAVEIRSVLLGVLAVEKLIDFDELFNAAFYEELFQQREWGITEENMKNQRLIKEKLVELEKLRNERSLFEN